MPEYREPGPPRASRVRKALQMAQQKPGEWVMVGEYGSPGSATTVGHRLRSQEDDLETTVRGRELFVRVVTPDEAA